MTFASASETIARFFAFFEASDAEAAAGLIADDVVWWVQSRGVMDKAQICANNAGIIQATQSRKMTIVGAISEAHRTAVEIDCEMFFHDGRTLRNTMHIAFTVENGKISAAREYMDTAAVLQFMQR